MYPDTTMAVQMLWAGEKLPGADRILPIARHRVRKSHPSPEGSGRCRLPEPKTTALAGRFAVKLWQAAGEITARCIDDPFALAVAYATRSNWNGGVHVNQPGRYQPG